MRGIGVVTVLRLRFFLLFPHSNCYCLQSTVLQSRQLFQRNNKTTERMNDELREIRRLRWEQATSASKSAEESKTSSAPPVNDDAIESSRKRTNSSSVLIDLTSSDNDESPKKSFAPVLNEQNTVPLKLYSAFLSANNKKNRRSSEEEGHEKAADARENTVEVTFATWNIWFGPPHPEMRMAHIASIVTKDIRPMFIGLQEVTLELSNVLFPLLQSEGYTILCQPDAVTNYNSYGCAIGVLLGSSSKIQKSGFLPFSNSIMGRGLLFALVELKGGQNSSRILFATTHLESFVRGHPETNQARQDQIKETIQFVDQFVYSNRNKNINIVAAVVTGDLNWDDERLNKNNKNNASSKTTSTNTQNPPLLPLVQSLSSSCKGAPWVDAFLEKKTNEGFTYDAKSNPMLQGGNLQRRFDRCLLKFFVDGSCIQACNLYGKDCIPGITWDKSAIKRVPVCPSDHYALAATVVLPTS